MFINSGVEHIRFTLSNPKSLWTALEENNFDFLEIVDGNVNSNFQRMHRLVTYRFKQALLNIHWRLVTRVKLTIKTIKVQAFQVAINFLKYVIYIQPEAM